MTRDFDSGAEVAKFLTNALYRERLYWENGGHSIYTQFEYKGDTFHFEVGLDKGTIHLQQRVDGAWVDIHTTNGRR